MTQTKESKTVSSLKEPTEAPFLSKHTTNNNDREWTVKTTQVANDTINPIRLIVEGIKQPVNPPKPVIRLSIGDPTVFGNLSPPKAVTEALVAAAASGKYNGYAGSTGLPIAREAIAAKYSTAEAPLTADDIIIASGCSGSLAIAMQGVAGRGENILVPNPGFSLYHTIASHNGIESRPYPLLPAQGWQADMKALENLVDDNTKAILINNPSNPTGSSYSKQHLLALIAFAERRKILIIADEIYADMVFKGESFHPLASLTQEVPVLSCSGIAKQYLVPGWRLGWICMHNKKGRMSEVVAGLKRLSMLILGACTLPQAALPAIFANTPPTFLSGLMSQLQRQTLYLVERIRQITGLEPIVPQGAMYLMVRMDGRVLDFEDDQVFVQRLLDEAQVFVLPGSCFGAPMFFRIVTCPSIDVLSDACDRLEEFCARHHRGQGAATVELMDEKRQDVGDKKDSAEGTKLNPVNKMA